jgi:hypothetical protein
VSREDIIIAGINKTIVSIKSIAAKYKTIKNNDNTGMNGIRRILPSKLKSLSLNADSL